MPLRVDSNQARVEKKPCRNSCRTLPGRRFRFGKLPASAHGFQRKHRNRQDSVIVRPIILRPAARDPSRTLSSRPVSPSPLVEIGAVPPPSRLPRPLHHPPPPPPRRLLRQPS